jgi:hypothetical protein
VAGSCEYGDEPLGSGTTELVSLVSSCMCTVLCFHEVPLSTNSVKRDTGNSPQKQNPNILMAL